MGPKGGSDGAAWAGLAEAMPASATAAASHRMVACFMAHKTRRTGLISQIDTRAGDVPPSRPAPEQRAEARIATRGYH
ncbi:hypothetical protein Asi03nite_35070 [Actinoplanes siamensis]|uniref:Uncharacterized protein n=1 Tax=Actinoplanes siamensis TaxID=1223317 RepID=A0A919N7Z8_9ACTN|nr:hypothetical protein Asi03nite_35070 [Actinoplanes siamensis]